MFISPKERVRIKYLLATLVMVLLTIGVGFLILNLQAVQNLLPKAAGEPANIIVTTNAVLGLMPRPWRNLAQGGEENDWRMGSLVGPVKALHPEYIRLDHIFTFYNVVSGSPGNLSFDFSKLDPVLNDIRATGATPYIALSYMPPALTGGGDILAPPQRWTDWQLVVRKTIEHISGQQRFANVYYEVWNEPDLFGDWKTYGPKNYLELYRYSAYGAAQAQNVQNFKLGGPATTGLYENWFTALADFTQQNNLRFDFFSWHRYSDDVDQYRQDMIDVRSWLQKYPQLANLELHITEWGHDSKNNPGYDNNYGAAHTVAGAIEMVGVVERAFAFEIQDGADPGGQAYWGRWGLFTSQSAGSQAKPRYTALKLLDQLGDQRLQLQGKGSFVKGLAAKDDAGAIQVVLANFDPQGKNTENVPVTFLALAPGTYTLTQKQLNGRQISTDLTVGSDGLKTSVVMQPNTVAFLQLTPKN